MSSLDGMPKWVVLLLVALSACGPGFGDEVDGGATSGTPRKVACNTVEYAGCQFDNIGCKPGVSSFDMSRTQGSCTANFHIECSAGCVSSVRLK